MNALPPFEFVQCTQLHEILPQIAWDARELLDGIEDAPADSLSYHTRSSFLRSRYLAAPYPNDFATWAAIQARDRVLGEHLAAIDPFDVGDIEQLRAELVGAIDHHLATVQIVPRADQGAPFYFMRATLIEIPTGTTARNLREFRDAVARVDPSAIYYHFYAAGRRADEADPLAWLQRSGNPDVATGLRQLDRYVTPLEGLRAQALAICDAALAGDSATPRLRRGGAAQHG